MPHIGDQARLHPLLVRDCILAESKRVILTRHSLRLGIGTGGVGEKAESHRKRDHSNYAHRTTPRQAAAAATAWQGIAMPLRVPRFAAQVESTSPQLTTKGQEEAYEVI
jgi:hypothetical protein